MEIDDQQYLLNDTNNHLLVVPAAQKVSKKAQSLSPIDLTRDSFEEFSSFVTPSVKKVTKRAATTSLTFLFLKTMVTTMKSSMLLATGRREGQRPYMFLSHLKFKSLSKLNLTLEVDSREDLPQTLHSKTVDGNLSNKSVNLLTED
jgi:hypothetical protein